MSIARYGLNSQGVFVSMTDGGFVSYQDYAKLAAENAGLKDINAWCKTDAFKNMYREFKTAEALGCHDVDCMHDAMLTALMHAPETPATDAFLAEVRSSAFNDLCAAFVKHKELAGLDDSQEVTVFEATDALLHCAEQLDTNICNGVQS